MAPNVWDVEPKTILCSGHVFWHRKQYIDLFDSVTGIIKFIEDIHIDDNA